MYFVYYVFKKKWYFIGTDSAVCPIMNEHEKPQAFASESMLTYVRRPI